MTATAFITVDGRRTRVRLAGDPEHPPVVLLHGIGRSLEDWSLQIPRLAALYRVIAVDLPGSGFSARPSGTATLDVLARAVADTLETLGERRAPHIVGNSLGGAVAMTMAARHPDRVASLTLVDSVGFGDGAALPFRLLALPVVGELMMRRTTRTGARMTERMLFADRRLVSASRVEHARAIAAQSDRGRVVLETTRTLATFRGIKPGWRAEVTTANRQHPRPTLIVWGDRDRVTPIQHLEAARRLLPHASTHVVLGAGHVPQIERPDEFATRSLRFLAGVERQARASADSRQSQKTKGGA